MASSKYVSTPADPKTKLDCYGDPFTEPTKYRQIVGSLQYATRPDISFAVNRVC